MWSAQKGEAPDKGVLGTVPTRRGTHCLRGSFSSIGSTLGTPRSLGTWVLLSSCCSAQLASGMVSALTPKASRHSRGVLGCGEGFLGIWCECSIPPWVRRGDGLGGDGAVVKLDQHTQSSWRWRVKLGSQSCVPKGCYGLGCSLFLEAAVSRFKDPWHG